MNIKNSLLKIAKNLSNSRIFKFVLIISIWILSLRVLEFINILNNVDGNLLIVVHLAVFFFALTASPTTWVVKGLFGFEAGSNDPKHTHISFNENSHQGQVDVREYGEKNEFKRLVEVANQLKIKK